MIFLKDFVVFTTDFERFAAALWVMHTYVLDHIDNTPRLAVCAPDKQCGKTRALEVLDKLCWNPLLTFNASPAAIVGEVEDNRPTLLLDEIDTVFGEGENGNLRALINAGYRKGSIYLRCDNFGRSRKRSKAYCAVATAGIGTPPETIYDRSVVVNLRRKTRSEVTNRFRKLDKRSSAIVTKLLSWAKTVGDMPDVEMPDEISDRQQDIWECLIWIASLMNPEIEAYARSACVRMCELQYQETTEMSKQVRLLRDIKDIFDGMPSGIVSFLTSDQLVEDLKFDESEWSQLEYGQPVLTQVKLANALRGYGIHTRSKRLGNTVLKVYFREDFKDSWERYLGVDVPVGTVAD